MSNNNPMEENSQKLRTRIINSRLASWIANSPPVAWTTRRVIRLLFKPKIDHAAQPITQEIVGKATGLGLQATLDGVVSDVVDTLGYIAAMVATYEQGDALPVRAFYIDPKIASLEQVRAWEEQISKIKGEAVSVADPKLAPKVSVAYRYDPEHKENLSVRAIEAEHPIISDDLYDLLRPVAPESSIPAIAGIQDVLNIHKVIAVPFFVETSDDDDGATKKEVVGNLFAAKRSDIEDQDLILLSAFGRQAAAAIEGERRRQQNKIVQDLVLAIQSNLQKETKILQLIVKGVVEQLRYVAAMVATYEQGDALPVRAFYIDPNIASPEQVRAWEEQISKMKGEVISVSDPELAPKVSVAYRYNPEYKNNLSVQAIEAGRPIVRDDLYDLLRPVAPESSKPAIAEIQDILDVHSVIAVPFFIGTSSDNGTTKKEVVGNLFAISRSRTFFSREVEMLKVFGQQAAVGIRNARLYRKSEERRNVAQVFAKMAFNANTAVHDLSNAVGVISPNLKKIKPPLNFEDRPVKIIQKGLIKTRELIEKLAEDPFRDISDEPVDINRAIARAKRKVEHPEKVNLDGCDKNLPKIRASYPVLSEVFRIFIKNGLEAMEDAKSKGSLSVTSKYIKGGNNILVTIQDSGTGIKDEHLPYIFDLKWTTKKETKGGLGFGLFFAKDTIENMGGSIDLESKFGQGTTFLLRFSIENSQDNLS